MKIPSGDWLKRIQPMEEIYEILKTEKIREVESDELVFRMRNRLEVR